MTVIRLVGLVTGPATCFDGEYVAEYDPSCDGVDPSTGLVMTCHLRTTPNRAHALELSAGAALRLWAAIDQRHPRRPDGKPNRPLSAFSVTFER